MECYEALLFGTYKPNAFEDASRAAPGVEHVRVKTADQAALLAENADLRRQLAEMLSRSIAAENELQREKDNFYTEFGVVANNLHQRVRQADLECETHKASVVQAQKQVSALAAQVEQLKREVEDERAATEAARGRAADLERNLQEAKVDLQVLTSKLESNNHPKQLKHLKAELIKLEKEKTLLRNEKEAAEEMLDNTSRKLNAMELASRQAVEQYIKYEGAVVVLASEVVKNVDAGKMLSAIRLYLDVETQKMQLATIHGKEAFYNKALSFLAAYKNGEMTLAVQRTCSAAEEKRKTEPSGAYGMALKMLQEITGRT